MKRYHVYSDNRRYYDWTTSKKSAITLAKKWTGHIYCQSKSGCVFIGHFSKNSTTLGRDL